MTWPGGPVFTQRGRIGDDSARKLADIRALVDGWVTVAFQKPNDAAAQVKGECAALILRITDP